MCNLNYLDKPQKTRGQQVAHPTLAAYLYNKSLSEAVAQGMGIDTQNSRVIVPVPEWRKSK